MTFLGLFISLAIAAVPAPQDLLTGLYLSEDGTYTAILEKQELTIGDLFTPPTYGYKTLLVSNNQSETALEFEKDLTLELGEQGYAFDSEIECDDPGCDYFQDFSLQLVDAAVPSLKLFYSGFTYADDEEERSWSDEAVLTRAYTGLVKTLETEEVVYSKTVQALVLARMKKDLKEGGFPRKITQEDDTILSTVYKKVVAGRSVTAIYVTTKAQTLPLRDVVERPKQSQCDMVAVKNDSKWTIKYSDCFVGDREVIHRP
jgi:hypothetical protein